MNSAESEQSLVLIKPDALKNSLTGYVLSQLSEYHSGLIFAGAKIVNVSKLLAEEHYAEHKGKGFFPSLIDYITGVLHFPSDPGKRRVKAYVYQGTDAIKKIREICGPTNPLDAREKKPGCIRSLGTLVPIKDETGKQIGDRMDNLIHASANASDAEREIKLWFRPADIPASMRMFPTEICEEFIYVKNDKPTTTYEKGSVCIFAPGDIAWKSDIDALRAHLKGTATEITVGTVVAKYVLHM